MDGRLAQKIQALPLWQGDISITPIDGGITNINVLVEDAESRYVVRLGEDILAHHVMRFNEHAASIAAHTAGLSPAVLHVEQGIAVLEYIDSQTLTPEALRKPENLSKILPLIQSCHRDVAEHFRGPALVFWVFHVVRDYIARLRESKSTYLSMLPPLLEESARLEQAAGPFTIVFGHNDLLAANILDDGSRLWLIDWDYAGFNSPLFDLGGLASNNELDSEQEYWLLENYFETPVTDHLMQQYSAMKCASLLRETLWSMVSELGSAIDFDYAAYTADNLARYRNAYTNLQS